MSSMPAGRGVIEPVEGAALHALSLPARRFTGDFYFTHRADDALWLALGDVAGKGLHAAVIMAVIQEELEHRIASCARTACDPAVTMQRLHEVLRPILPPNRFATAVIARLHDDGTLLLANAGHCPPLIARAGGRIEQIGSTGPAAGILEPSRWTTARRRLAPGETLLLYSDGLIEANDFGVPALSGALRAAASQNPSPRSIAAALARAVRDHGGIDDDLTLLVATR
ncbi:MAG TPA: PP2C family protein-serine/threonine phosphatase [Thermoanaerobaculia bacterium]|nr:PP2C family protein-serine/threonine phosphatase [Thermoanaerobaculia bacterium]